MRLFASKHESVTKRLEIPTSVWPADAIDDIDDATFARAIAEGREAEQRELVSA